MKTKAKKIKLLILDVDGVLTDGTLYITESGSEYKAFNVKDGLGIKMLLQTGVEVAIISGRKSTAVSHYLGSSLGVKYIYQGQNHKLIAFEELKTKLKVTNSEIAYIGDDLMDLPIINQKIGLMITVADADKCIKDQADFITSAPGGKGAVREVCELIMAAQQNLDKIRNKLSQQLG